MSEELWTRLPGQGSWNRTAVTQAQPARDSLDTTSGAGHLEPNDSERTAETGRAGQDRLTCNLDRTERTGRSDIKMFGKHIISLKIPCIFLAEISSNTSIFMTLSQQCLENSIFVRKF